MQVAALAASAHHPAAMFTRVSNVSARAETRLTLGVAPANIKCRCLHVHLVIAARATNTAIRVPSNGGNETTIATRLGFSVPSLTNALGQLRGLDATVLVEPSDTEFGRRAVVKDFEGHKVELYEKGA